MEPGEALLQLTELLQELELAVEDNDWDEVALIDKDILVIAKQYPADQRSTELEEQFALVREIYRQVFASSDERRAELQQKMSQMRESRGGISGYKNSLAAGNREVRGMYDAA